MLFHGSSPVSWCDRRHSLGGVSGVDDSLGRDRSEGHSPVVLWEGQTPWRGDRCRNHRGCAGECSAGYLDPLRLVVVGECLPIYSDIGVLIFKPHGLIWSGRIREDLIDGSHSGAFQAKLCPGYGCLPHPTGLGIPVRFPRLSFRLPAILE